MILQIWPKIISFAIGTFWF